MRKRELILILSVITLISLSVIGTVNAQDVRGNPEIDVAIPNNQLTPGTETVLEVFLTNDGNIQRGGNAEFEQRVQTARNTKVLVEEGNAPLSVETGERAIGTLPEGVSQGIPFRVAVNRDADPGTYYVDVKVSYTYTHLVEMKPSGPKYYDRTSTETHRVTVEIDKRGRFRVVDSESDVNVGEKGVLDITLRNTGNEPARDARISAHSTNPDIMFGEGQTSTQAFIGNWQEGASKTTELTVLASSNARERGYSVELTVNFLDSDGVERTSIPIRAGVFVGGEQSFTITEMNERLHVGEDGEIQGVIRNDGPANVTSPVLLFQEKDRHLHPQGTEYALPDMEPGQSESFKFDVDVSESASSGLKQLDFAMSYRNNQGDESITDTFTSRVEVAERRDEFNLSVLENTVATGSTNTLRLRITNNRDRTLTDISAKLFPDGMITSNDDEAFIPRLEPGESEDVTLGIGTSQGATPKIHRASLDFEYDTPDGVTHVSSTYKVPIDVTENTGGMGSYIMMLFVILIISGIGYYIWKRR